MDSRKDHDRPDAPLHKQKRATLTRSQLLRSARAVFARDGFEPARIEEIAAKAGKTRGAFYDNFKDKEDIFLAIFEENTDCDLAKLSELLDTLPDVEHRVEALSQYLIELSKDRERILLSLEFKLFAVRHPRKRRRLAALFSAMPLRGTIPEFDRLLPKTARGNAQPLACEPLAICGLLDGLALSHLFNPDSFDCGELARSLKLCLRETLGG
jgi:AcrR family transcriptional regulator